MEPPYPKGWQRRAVAAICAALVAAGVFEALSVLATQDKAVWAASPWRDDPYHTALGLAELVVPALGSLIVLRLFAWRAPGGADRGRQLVRAAGTTTALIGVALAFEWAALAGAAHRAAWHGWTAVLIGGLAVSSALAAAAGVLLARCRWPRGADRWRYDGVGDVALLCRWAPVPRRWTGRAAVTAVRRHALSLFVGASVLAAGAIAGAQCVGEGITDPLLVGWYFASAATSLLACCLAGNALTGFVARPVPGRGRRAVEAGLVAGGVAGQLAVAFRDPFRVAIGLGPVASVPTLAVDTLGPWLGAAVVAAALVLAGTRKAMAHTGREIG